MHENGPVRGGGSEGTLSHKWKKGGGGVMNYIAARAGRRSKSLPDVEVNRPYYDAIFKNAHLVTKPFLAPVPSANQAPSDGTLEPHSGVSQYPKGHTSRTRADLSRSTNAGFRVVALGIPMTDILRKWLDQA